MMLTVYVDLETFHNLVLEKKTFDACLNEGLNEDIQLSVPIQAVYTHEDEDMVTIRYVEVGTY